MKNFLKLSIAILLCVFFVNLLFETNSYAAENQEQNADIIVEINNLYKERAEKWGTALKDVAFKLFGVFLTIDILLFGFSGGIGMATGNKNIASVMGELVLNVILPAAFMYAVIHNYQDWSKEILQWIKDVAEFTEPNSKGADNFFLAGVVLCKKIWDSLSFFSPSTYVLIFAGIIVLICFMLISMQMLLILCESYIVLNAGIIILGLGSFNQTRQYAMNFIRYVLSVGVKLFVMELMSGLAFSFVEDFMKTEITINNISVILGASIIMLGLIRVIPDICSGIIQGQHVGTGNALSGAIGSVTAGAMGALAVGKQIGSNIGGAANTVSALSDTMKAASDAGLSGASKAGFVAKTMAGAMGGEAGKNSAMGSFASRLVSQAEGNASGINAKNMQSAEAQQHIKDTLKL